MAILRLHRAAPAPLSRWRLMVLVPSLLVAVAGCATADSPAAPADDVELVEGREIFIDNCANCHGGAGGGGVGSKLDEGRLLERYPEPADQVALVTNGVRAMPGFGEKLTAAEIAAVVRYTRELIAGSG